MNGGFTKFKEEAINISAFYPKLIYAESEAGMPFLYGELELKDDTGLFVDSYFIRIQPTLEYPLRFPHVFETNGRIPINIDWHIYPDGHCCIKAIPEETVICRKGIDLNQFINKQLIPYFFNQKYRELHGFFFKERAHGDQGNIEYFKELFKTVDLSLIKNALLSVRYNREPLRTAKCFCGNGEKYRKCHRAAFRTLRILSDEELNYHINSISKYTL